MKKHARIRRRRRSQVLVDQRLNRKPLIETCCLRIYNHRDSTQLQFATTNRSKIESCLAEIGVTIESSTPKSSDSENPDHKNPVNLCHSTESTHVSTDPHADQMPEQPQEYVVDEEEFFDLTQGEVLIGLHAGDKVYELILIAGHQIRIPGQLPRWMDTNSATRLTRLTAASDCPPRTTQDPVAKRFNRLQA